MAREGPSTRGSYPDLGNFGSSEIRDKPLHDAWDMLGTCLGHAWDMLGTCLGHAWDVHGTWACWCHAFERLGSSVVCTSSAFSAQKEQIGAMHRAFPYHPMIAQNHLRILV